MCSNICSVGAHGEDVHEQFSERNMTDSFCTPPTESVIVTDLSVCGSHLGSFCVQEDQANAFIQEHLVPQLIAANVTTVVDILRKPTADSHPGEARPHNIK